MAIDISIIRNFFVRDFLPNDMDKVWTSCPNRMLWETIRAEDAVIVSHADVLTIVKQTSEVYVLPEPLPSLYLNQEVTCTLVSSFSFVDDFSKYVKTEPLYVFSNDFSWMIVFTTENTQDGEQICVFVKNIYAE